MSKEGRNGLPIDTVSLVDACELADNSTRKTGITVKDTGIRDEHGFEVIDGIFSSPEKPSPKKRGITNNTTITSEEDMEIGQSRYHYAKSTANHCCSLPFHFSYLG